MASFPIKSDTSFLETGDVSQWRELIDKCLSVPRRDYQFTGNRLGIFYDTFQHVTFEDLDKKYALYPQPIPFCMQDLIDKVNAKFGTDFNNVFIRTYPDGYSGIRPHFDNDKILSDNKAVLISVGAVRTFRIRDRIYPDIEVDVPTASYGYICMGGDFQKEYTHEIPIEPSVKGVRYSINFRKVVVDPVYQGLTADLAYRGIYPINTADFWGFSTLTY